MKKEAASHLVASFFINKLSKGGHTFLMFYNIFKNTNLAKRLLIRFKIGGFMSIVSVKPEISKEGQHLSEEINSLQQLYEQGILTEEEFKKSKQKLLD